MTTNRKQTYIFFWPDRFQSSESEVLMKWMFKHQDLQMFDLKTKTKYML